MIHPNSGHLHKELNEKAELVIVAALLHDVLEDTALHPLDMKIEFGSDIVNTVLEITKVDQRVRQRVVDNGEVFAKMKTQDVVAVCVKLADRLHNLVTIDGHNDKNKRRKIAQETLDFFIEPAVSLGFSDLAKDLKASAIYILEHGKVEGYSFGDLVKV